MPNEDQFASFLTNLQQEVISRSEGQEQLREDAFTEVMIDYLIEAGEFDEGIACQHRGRGVQVNGYGVSEDEECLDLFVSNCGLKTPPETMPKRDIETLFKRVREFLEKSMNGYVHEMEEASPAFDLALRIAELKSQLTRVRLFLFTDGVSKMEEIPNETLGEIEISYHVWDIERLFRCWNSGSRRETIEVDFLSIMGHPVPCLAVAPADGEYACYLTSLTGTLLVELYSRFGPRLLERNVRCFLQARGKINKGIRSTILSEPAMFLAYNNGLSVTAESITTIKTADGTLGITKARDFQIVNGGQTMGSIYHSVRRDRADVSGITVPVKLTVLFDPTRVEAVVPKISEYANSQNKVNTADFQANDPFHMGVEELSRTIWAPAADGMQRQTRWYYERARGQYQDDKSRCGTPAQLRQFEAVHPKRQMFTKTDLAKFENTWTQLPHLVSRGAQKNFWEFTLLLRDRGRVTVDERYFQRLVAKAILFREAEKIIQAQKYGGYRANIVTYTLAWLSRKSSQRIDLDRVWREQKLTLALEEAIRLVSVDIHKHIISPPGGGNITEWCKKETCWQSLKDAQFELPETFEKDLIPIEKSFSTPVDRGIDAPTEEERKLIEEIAKIPSEVWFRISKWAKETDNLQGWQRSIAYSMGKVLGQGREPSRKQAVQAKKILEEAERLGCRVKQ
jgi:AIPR protein/abortive infection phage resistance-like protein